MTGVFAFVASTTTALTAQRLGLARRRDDLDAELARHRIRETPAALAFGLKTRTPFSGQMWAIIRRCPTASKPVPISPSVGRRLRDHRQAGERRHRGRAHARQFVGVEHRQQLARRDVVDHHEIAVPQPFDERHDL